MFTAKEVILGPITISYYAICILFGGFLAVCHRPAFETHARCLCLLPMDHRVGLVRTRH